jgi:N-acetylneuraminic acid mutarotase
MKTMLHTLRACCLSVMLASTAISLYAQGTAFTYQGRLTDGTNAANGIYDLRFTIYDSTNNPGTVVAGSLTNSAVGVSNGLFTAMLDFGGGVFNGADRWLEIGVRTNGGGAFTVLSPRQPLTPAPYAIYASGVSAAGISGTIPAGNIANGTITSNMLAAGAAAANLAASGKAGVPSGGIIMSTNASDTNLTTSGYVKLGKVGFLEWEQQPGGSGGAPSEGANQTAVWTGSEMLVWGGQAGGYNAAGSGGRLNPVAKTWTPISTNGAPAARYSHTAVWSGSEMIIWGGVNSSSPSGLNDGGRYNPVTDTWTPIPNSLSNTPAARLHQTAVWTGNEMIIWGGYNGGVFNNGGRYNPAANTWTPIESSLTNTPSPRFWHTAVWAGTEMIIWGGKDIFNFLNDGGRYDPAANAWTSISNSLTNNPTARHSHTAVWTGTEMIVWGGWNGSGFNGGGRYNPAGDTWTVLTTANAPAPRFHHTAVWTGAEMIVWGGDLNTYGSCYNDGGRFNPAADIWTMVTTTGAPAARTQHTAVWTGSEMIIFGGGNLISYFNDTWSYTPGKVTYLYLKP